LLSIIAVFLVFLAWQAKPGCFGKVLSQFSDYWLDWFSNNKKWLLA